MTYTDFQISMGIKGQDDRYPSIIRGLISELYSKYGIVISRDQESLTEVVNAEYNTAFSLKFKLISNVQFSGVEGQDYVVDYDEGTITILSSGNLLENTDYTITYNYVVFMNQSNTLSKTIYLYPEYRTYKLGIAPIRSLISVKQGNEEWVEGTDFYFFNGQIELIRLIQDYRTPIVVTVDAGYEQIPFDLKQAFYELAQFRFGVLDKQTNLISSVDNGQTKTSYRTREPDYIHNTFMNHSPLGYAYAD